MIPQAAAAIALALSGASVADEPAFVIEQLGSIGGAGSWATSVNISGYIVGRATSPVVGGVSSAHAFLYTGGEIFDIGPAGAISAAYDINDHSQIVGHIGYQAAMWELPRPRLLETPPGYESFAAAINNRGTVVGSIVDLTGDDPFAYLPVQWKNDKLELLPVFLDAEAAFPADINEAGVIVGMQVTAGRGDRAVMWTNAGLVDLGSLFESPSNAARAINDEGVIVGHSGIPYSPQLYTHRAFRWEAGRMHDLGSLGGIRSEAWDVNNHGEVVGAASTPTAYEHAFIWRDGVMYDLNDLIDPDSGWVLEAATAISDRRLIVGYGRVNGVVQAFALYPNAGF